MNFEAIIGLEIHIEMKTKSKMFSSSPVTYGAEPNTNVSPFDMAFPGSMPTVNKQAVINAIRVWGFSLLGNKHYWKFVHCVMLVTLIVMGTVSMYDATVGMEYVRRPLEIERYKGEIKKEDFKKIATYFVEDYNKIALHYGVDEQGELKSPYNRATIIDLLRDEYKRLNDNPYFSKYTPKAKALGSSGLFTSVGIVGMYFGVLGEANYNTYSTNAEFPFYVAHEMAHGKGVMREHDAQAVATYICLTSENEILRYSAYYNTIESILDILHLSDNKNDYKEVKALINDTVWKNLDYIYNHWKGKMFLYDLGNQINDWYLKTFRQKEGTNSYNDDEPDVDDKGDVIALSNYQSIYFDTYYNNVPEEA